MNQQKEKRASLDKDLKTVKGDREKEQEIKQAKDQLDKDLRINSAIFFTTNSTEIEHYSVYPYLSPAGESTIQEF